MDLTGYRHDGTDSRWHQLKAAADIGDFGQMLGLAESLVADGEFTLHSSIAEIYERGTDKMPRDASAAIAHYRVGIEKLNDPACHVGLGRCFYLGNGVEKDFEKAKTHFEMADEKGEPTARLYLGRLYFLGLGVPVDLDKSEAYLWPLLKQEYVSAYFLIARIRWMRRKYVSSIKLWLSGNKLELEIKKFNPADTRLL